MEKITSLQNNKIKKWNALHKKKERDIQNRFLIEGEHLIQEALDANIVETIITDQDCPFVFEEIVYVTKEIMHKLSDNVSQVHYIAVCKKVEVEQTKMNRILLLDDVQDPGNLGTLIRTAISFQFDGIYVSDKTVDLYNDKVIRSTQGALFKIPVIRTNIVEKIKDLQAHGVQVIATSLEKSQTMSELPPKEKMAFVLGNEGQGVSKEVLKNADAILRIEMSGFESLNVAVAGGIIMYHYRQG